MKKLLIIPVAMAAVLAFASCDDKACYCYERTSATHVEETVTYTHPDTPCSALNSAGRGCLESNERGTINPQDIAK